MSMETSLEDAKSDKLFYVTANVILVDVVNRACLMLRRGADEKEAQGLWSFPGGKGEHEQIVDGRIANFFGAVALQESHEESGLVFDIEKSIVIANGAFVRKDLIPVVWTTLAAPYEGGEVNLESGSFSEYNWFTEDALPLDVECVGSSREEAIRAIHILSS